MRESFLMPQLGMGMTEGTVVHWLCEVGDVVEEGMPVAEVEAEKVEVEVESPFAGTIVELVVEEGIPVDVGTVLAYIETAT